MCGEGGCSRDKPLEKSEAIPSKDCIKSVFHLDLGHFSVVDLFSVTTRLPTGNNKHPVYSHVFTETGKRKIKVS